MPIYEYECTDCGHRFEVMQSATARPKRKCPECAGALRKVFHPVGIIFKGSGWHITDYSRNGGSKEKSKSDSESKIESSTECKSEKTTSASKKD